MDSTATALLNSELPECVCVCVWGGGGGGGVDLIFPLFLSLKEFSYFHTYFLCDWISQQQHYWKEGGGGGSWGGGLVRLGSVSLLCPIFL